MDCQMFPWALGKQTGKMALLFLSHRRTAVGLFAYCNEKNEETEHAEKRAFGLGSRVPWDVQGKARRRETALGPVGESDFYASQPGGL